jgi:hypothetical protein
VAALLAMRRRRPSAQVDLTFQLQVLTASLRLAASAAAWGGEADG